MTVHVVICTDPSDRGAECWTHGVYIDRATAWRAYNRLSDNTTWTVRLDKKQVRLPKPTKKAKR